MRTLTATINLEVEASASIVVELVGSKRIVTENPLRTSPKT